MLEPKKSKFTKKQKVQLAKGAITGILKSLIPPDKETRDLKKRMREEKRQLQKEFPDADFKKGGATKNKKWIQKAINPAHKGYCTPMSKATCTPKRKALARTLKKMAKNR
jgi:predicted adenine nucleotide alpha hydrolase (AANH) superfamily ATPase